MRYNVSRFKDTLTYFIINNKIVTHIDVDQNDMSLSHSQKY